MTRVSININNQGPVLDNSLDTCKSGRNGRALKRQDVTLTAEQGHLCQKLLQLTSHHHQECDPQGDGDGNATHSLLELTWSC